MTGVQTCALPIYGAVVVLPQGDAAAHRGVQTVVQGACGVQADHGQAVDGEEDEVEPVPSMGGPDQQNDGTHESQNSPCAMGDGGPGSQTVVGVPLLLFLLGGGGTGDMETVRLVDGAGRYVIHNKVSFQGSVGCNIVYPEAEKNTILKTI